MAQALSEQQILNAVFDSSSNTLRTGAGAVDDAAYASDDTVTLVGAVADETSPDSVDEGDIGYLRMTLTRFLKTSLGDLIAGEDLTNTLMQVVEKPVAVSTYAPDMDTSAALEASSVSKASAGVLYGFSASNTNAAGRWIQFFNSATLPADTAVPVLEFVIGAAEPRFRGGLPRRLRRRNAFELF